MSLRGKTLIEIVAGFLFILVLVGGGGAAWCNASSRNVLLNRPESVRDSGFGPKAIKQCVADFAPEPRSCLG